MTNLQLEGDKLLFVEKLTDFIVRGSSRESLEILAKDVVLSELIQKDWEDVLDCADSHGFPPYYALFPNSK